MDYLKNVINGMVTNTSQLILVVSICDIDAGNKISHGYYHFGERQLLQNLEVYLVAGSNNFSIFGLSDSHDHWQKVIL